MNPIKRLANGIAWSAALALVGLLATSATAQNFSDRTVFAETTPFEVGSVRLEPGTYMIRVMLLPSERNLIQITDQAQTKIYVSVLSTPHPIRGDQTVAGNQFEYYPPTPGHAKALRTWFSNNSALGHDFVYPKSRALELAAAIHAPVPALAEGVPEADFPSAQIEMVEPETQVAQTTPPPAEPVQVADSSTGDSLPQGASSVPLTALIGLLSIGAAFGIRMLRKA